MALALASVPRIPDPRVLVGNDSADDAGVFQIAPDRALVHTVDLLAPVVDDPYTFGRIAAVNSLSDVYAMGGTPLAALNVIGYPGGGDPETLGAILRGGQDAVVEAGAAVVGGHTFQNAEIRYGLAVTGEIHPGEIYANNGAQVGDLLVLTKPLGAGTIMQAIVNGREVPDEMYRAAVEGMLRSNQRASELMRKHRAHACTDVTGFGFLGHCWEMTDSGRIGIEIDYRRIPVHPGVMELIRDGVVNSGCKNNIASFEDKVQFDADVPPEYRGLLFSSETSGGLLIALPATNAEALLLDLGEGIGNAGIIGKVVGEHAGTVKVAKSIS